MSLKHSFSFLYLKRRDKLMIVCCVLALARLEIQSWLVMNTRLSTVRLFDNKLYRVCHKVLKDMICVIFMDQDKNILLYNMNMSLRRILIFPSIPLYEYFKINISKIIYKTETKCHGCVNCGSAMLRKNLKILLALIFNISKRNLNFLLNFTKTDAKWKYNNWGLLIKIGNETMIFFWVITLNYTVFPWILQPWMMDKQFNITRAR